MLLREPTEFKNMPYAFYDIEYYDENAHNIAKQVLQECDLLQDKQCIEYKRRGFSGLYHVTPIKRGELAQIIDFLNTYIAEQQYRGSEDQFTISRFPSDIVATYTIA